LFTEGINEDEEEDGEKNGKTSSPQKRKRTRARITVSDMAVILSDAAANC
jgi:hypothetical protein